MSERAVDFRAEYSIELIDDAAKAFVHRSFRKYLWPLVAACVVNVAGFVAILVLGGVSTWMLVPIGALAVLGQWSARRRRCGLRRRHAARLVCLHSEQIA
jgi:hypothetical protein